MDWLPLELWRASSLAQETRTCEAAYERLRNSGDTSSLAELRTSIERRIDDLEAFYVDNVDDERAVLFEKQRLKLRKLLHEYGSPSHHRPRPAAASSTAATSHQTPPPAARPADPAARRPPPPPAATAASASETPPPTRAPRRPKSSDRRPGSASKGSRASVGARSTGSPGSVRQSGGKKKKMAPIYKWEKKGLKEQLGEDVISDSSGDEKEPVDLVEPVLEFQIRLTPEEYKKVLLMRRRKAAETKFMNRAKFNKEASKSRAEAAADERGATGIGVSGPYVEPLMLETYMYRTQQPHKWITEKGFEHNARKKPIVST